MMTFQGDTHTFRHIILLTKSVQTVNLFSFKMFQNSFWVTFLMSSPPPLFFLIVAPWYANSSTSYTASCPIFTRSCLLLFLSNVHFLVTLSLSPTHLTIIISLGFIFFICSCLQYSTYRILSKLLRFNVVWTNKECLNWEFFACAFFVVFLCMGIFDSILLVFWLCLFDIVQLLSLLRFKWRHSMLEFD